MGYGRGERPGRGDEEVRKRLKSPDLSTKRVVPKQGLEP